MTTEKKVINKTPLIQASYSGGGHLYFFPEATPEKPIKEEYVEPSCWDCIKEVLLQK